MSTSWQTWASSVIRNQWSRTPEAARKMIEHLPPGVVASLLVLHLTDDLVLLVCAERLSGSRLVWALSFFDLIPSTEVPLDTIHRSRNARNVLNKREDLSVKWFFWRHSPTHGIILAFQGSNESEQKDRLLFSLGCYNRQQHSVAFCSNTSANPPVQQQ